MATNLLFKLRPMLKTEEEKEEERNLIFVLPRKKCEQMSPEFKRILAIKSNSIQQHRIHILKRILRRARYNNLDNTIMPYLMDFDKSEFVVPEGEVSKKIYNDVFHSRNIDLYGSLRKTVRHPPRKHLELRHLATKINVEFTQEMEGSYEEIMVSDEDEDYLIPKKRTVPKLVSESWKIGRKELKYAPVGLSMNPKEAPNSLGNEFFYSYDGRWKNGKMHGLGKYLFEDGMTYEGDFFENRPQGRGTSKYAEGQEANGDWRYGKLEGKATVTNTDGIKYEGYYVQGRRWGKGKLEYPSGLSYEGEFVDGKFNGRGGIKSKLTGWSYEGSFENGGICGHGTLIDPDGKRIIYYWPENRGPISLAGIVRFYLEEQRNEFLKAEQLRNELNAPLRGMQLREYVTRIRNALIEDRTKEKREKIAEAVKKAKEDKVKLQEARLKALAGEEEAAAAAEKAKQLAMNPDKK